MIWFYLLLGLVLLLLARAAFVVPQRLPSSRMSQAEALNVLGLRAGATPDEVQEAHRRLIQKMHPDQGGSEFLAQQINTARDVLLAK